VEGQSGPQLLGILRRSLRPRPGDLEELTFYSTGDVGALTYPRRRLAAADFERVFAEAALAPADAAVLWRFLTMLPAERHAVRLRAAQTISIFFKLDFDVERLAPLHEALGLEQLWTTAVDVASAIGSSPCGLAIEVGPQRAARMRLYWMGRNGVRDAAALGSPSFGLPAGSRDELVDAWTRLTPTPELVVVNVGAEPGAGTSLKLELPRVELRRASAFAATDPAARKALREARAAGARDVLPYLGLRWGPGARRELTAYVDAEDVSLHEVAA
jgi:hypothetical protein